MKCICHLSIWLSGLNVLQMQTDMRELRYLKNVMETEIIEGPHFIHHIDLYSNYSGNYILIYPSWYWVSKQFFGKIKSNLPNWRESCSVFTMNRCIAVWIYLPFSFLFFIFFFSFFLNFSRAASRSRCSCVWDSQVKELHFTAPSLTQHCTWLQDERCTCVQALKSVVGVTVRLSSQLFTIYIKFFFVLKFARRCFDMITFVWDRILRPFPLNPHPYTACLLPPCSAKIRGLRIKPCDVPIFFSSKLKNL